MVRSFAEIVYQMTEKRISVGEKYTAWNSVKNTTKEGVKKQTEYGWRTICARRQDGSDDFVLGRYLYANNQNKKDRPGEKVPVCHT